MKTKNYLMFTAAILMIQTIAAQTTIRTSPGSLQSTINQLAGMTGSMSGDIIIELSGGNYYLAEGIELNESHSGKNGHHVIIRNAPGEKPILYGGTEITGWQTIQDDPNGNGNSITLFKAPIPSGMDYLINFAVNGKQRIRSREPDVKLDAQGEWDFKFPDADGEDREVENTINQSDLIRIPQQVGDIHILNDLSDYDQIQMVLNRAWFARRFNITNLTAVGTIAEVTLSDYAEFMDDAITFSRSASEASFYLENAYEFLDQPGEWYVDTDTDFIYYYPKPGETTANITAVAPNVEQLLTLDNASYIKFYGLEFNVNNYRELVEYGCFERQAGMLWSSKGIDESLKTTFRGSLVPAMAQVEIRDSDHIAFERNAFRNAAGNGIDFFDGTNNIYVVGNVFFNTGSTPLFIGSSFPLGGDLSDLNHNIVMTDNYLENSGTVISGSAGMFTAFSGSVYFDRNYISGTGNLGLNTNWGAHVVPTTYMGMSKVRRNKIEYIGLRHTDIGAIHTKSASQGNEMFENIFANIQSSTVYKTAHEISHVGLYLDDSAMYQNVWDNYFDISIASGLRKFITKGTPTYFEQYLKTGDAGTEINNRIGNGISMAYNDISQFATNPDNTTLGNGIPRNFEYIDQGLTDDFESETLNERASDWFEYRGLMTVVDDNGNKVYQTDVADYHLPEDAPSVVLWGKGELKNMDMTVKVKMPGSVPTTGSFYLMSRYVDLFNSLQIGYDFSTGTWQVREKDLLAEDIVPVTAGSNGWSNGIHANTSDIDNSQTLEDITIRNVDAAVSTNQLSTANMWYTLRLALNNDQLSFYVNNQLTLERTVSHMDLGGFGVEFDGLNSPLYFDDFEFMPNASETSLADLEAYNDCDPTDPDCIYKNSFESESIGSALPLGYLPIGRDTDTQNEILKENENTVWDIQHLNVTITNHIKGRAADNIQLSLDVKPSTDILNFSLSFFLGFSNTNLSFSGNNTSGEWTLTNEENKFGEQTSLAVEVGDQRMPQQGEWGTVKMRKVNGDLRVFFNDQELFGLTGLNDNLDIEGIAVNVDEGALTTFDNIEYRRITTVNGPVAYFVNEPKEVNVGQTVSFTDQSVDATEWLWTIDNGSGTSYTSAIRNPSFTFSDVGSYDVTLKVSNNIGEDQVTRSRTIEVSLDSNVNFCSTSSADYCDDFESSAIGSNAPNWTVTNGIFSVNEYDGSYTYFVSGNGQSVLDDVTSADVSMRAKMQLEGTLNNSYASWLALRVQNGNAVQGGIYNGKWTIRERLANGTINVLGSNLVVAAGQDQWYDVELVAEGSTVTLYVNEEQVASGTTIVQGQGSVAFWTYNTETHYDDIQINSLSGGLNFCSTSSAEDYCDDFESSAIGSNAPNWTVTNGIFSVNEYDGSYTYFVSGNGQSVLDDVTSADVSMRAKMQLEGTLNNSYASWLALRVQNGNAVQGGIYNGKWTIRERLANGTINVLGSNLVVAAGQDQWYDVELVAEGSTVTLYVNEEQVASGTTIVQGQGSVAFWTYNTETHYDDIQINSLSGGLNFCSTSSADYCDDFESSAIGSNAPNWTVTNGIFSVNEYDGSYTYFVSGNGQSVLDDVTSADVSMRAKMQLEGTLNNSYASWLALRVQNGNAVQGGIYNGKWTIRERLANGTINVLGSNLVVAAGQDQWYDVELVAEGSTVTLYVNEEQVASGTTIVQGQGSVAFWTYNTETHYDDMQIKNLGAGSSALVASKSFFIELEKPMVKSYLYPNPVKNILTVLVPSSVFDNYKIYDVSGKVLLKGTVEAEETTFELMMNGFPNGVYLLSLKGKGGTHTMKVIKN